MVSHHVERLGVDDYEEMLDFINLVFSMAYSPHDFVGFLPAFYQPTPERMRCHWVIRKDGRIRSLVGVYPFEVRLLSHRLRACSVGAVSTHPSFRGQGMMSALMTHAVDWMKAEGIQLSELGGSRRRYAHFGFEVCGLRQEFQLTESSIGGEAGVEEPITVEEVGSGDNGAMQSLKQMHDQQILHCERPLEKFHDYGRNWKRTLCSIRSGDGSCSGYLVCSPRDRVSEIVAGDSALDAIRTCVLLSPSKRVTVSVGAHQLDLVRALGALCETVMVKPAGNWLVLDWPAVTTAYLQLRASSLPLPDGEVTLGIEGVGSLRLGLEGQRVRGSLTNEIAPWSCSPDMAHRLLFGPLPPDAVADLPASLSPLRSWCPLPLSVSHQDGA